MKLTIVYKLSLSAVILVLISSGLVGGLFYIKTTDVLVEQSVDDMAEEIRNAGRRVQTLIDAQREDVVLLASTPPIQGMLRALKAVNYDEKGESTYQQWMKRLESIFSTMLGTKSAYLKIRFINKSGQEMVVVGRDGEKIVALGDEQLQNKAHRIYVRETLTFPAGSVYLSEINLNREHGKVTEPHQEVLRSATPVYDEASGEIAGLLVITVKIGHELRGIQKVIQRVGREVYITNDHGGYLLHPDASKTYGFDLGKGYRIQEDIPRLAKLFLPDSRDMHLILQPEDTDGRAVVNFTKIAFDPAHPERFIAVGITERYSDIVAKQAGVLNEVLLLALALSAVVMLLAIVFAVRLSRPIKQITQVMEDYAHQRETTAVMPVNNNDEIGVLARSYEALIEQVGAARKDLENANSSLELKVVERTRELESSELYQRSIVENIVDGLIIIDARGTVASFNPAAVKIFGYQPDEVIGNNIKMLMPEPYHSEHDGYLDHYHKTSEKKIIGIGREVKGQRKDGSTFPLDLAVNEVRIGDAHYFTGIIRDITERKESERVMVKAKELAERNSQRLAESEARIRSVVETVIDGIVTIDAKGIIKSFNLAAERIFGYAADEVIERNVKCLMPEPYHSEHDGYLKNFRDTAVPRVIGIGREVIGRRKDGSTFPMDLAVNEMIIDGTQMFTGIVRDITERKQSERVMVEAKELAEKNNQMKSEFLNMMSHELRTPLTVILGYLPLLKNEAAMPEPAVVAEIAQDMDSAGAHLLALINDVLDLSKIEAGKMSLKSEEISLKSFIEELFKNLRMSTDAKGVSLICESDEIILYADPVRLKQILINLVGNSIKFTNHGSITVDVHQVEGGTEFRIIDTGSGIPEQDLPFIFDKFHQVDSSSTRNVGGTGLGLSITKKLIELHGGKVTVMSKPGEGTVFTFTILNQEIKQNG